MNRPTYLLALAVSLTFVTVSSPALGNIARTMPTSTATEDDHLGFEIGHGREIIRYLAGRAGIELPDRWESNVVGNLFQLVAPQFEGLPRSRFSARVIRPRGITTPTQLMRTKLDAQPAERDWMPIEFAGLLGIKREGPVDTRNLNGPRKLQIEVFHGNEIVAMSLEGRRRPDGVGTSPAFERLYDSLQNAITQ